MVETRLRTLRKGEEDTLLRILERAYGAFHSETDERVLLSSSRFDPDSCFIAEEDGLPVGSVAVTRLPRDGWFVFRYLAVTGTEKRTATAEALLPKALDCARWRKSKYVRATTPAIEPYVGIYKRFDFVPVRRDFRISWDLSRITCEKNSLLEVEEVSMDNSREAAQFFVRALNPYWDWHTKEHGGPDAVADSFIEGVKRGERWFLCSSKGKTVGLTGMIVDYYRPREGRFRGAYVGPEDRGKGIGLAVMKSALNLARVLGQDRMMVYTFSYLDCLAPGALLYVRSGGRIEAEYTQLAMG